MQVGTTYKDIRKVALPIILGNIVQSVLTVTNTAFLGRVGEITLGAAAIGGVFYFLIVTIAMGLAIGPQIIIARRAGEGRYSETGNVFNQSIYILLLLSICLFMILKLLTPVLFSHILDSQAIIAEANAYLGIMSYGIFFSVLNTGFRALYIGLARTKVLSYTIGIQVAVNIFFDYTLIFGKLGFPEMGIRGAATSSVIAEITAFLLYAIYTRYFLQLKESPIFKFGRWDHIITREVFRLSYPSILQFLISIGSWFLFFVIIEQTGEEPLAISNIVRSLLIMFMMPVWGFANTGNTMVSNIIGQGKREEVIPLIRKIINMAIIIAIVYLPFIILVPEWFIRIYTNDAHLIASSVRPLYVVYVALWLCIPGSISLFSLSGTGDTRTSFLIEVVAIVIYLSFSIVVALVMQLSLEYIWAAETLYWVVITLLAYLRLRSGKWKHLTV